MKIRVARKSEYPTFQESNKEVSGITFSFRDQDGSRLDNPVLALSSISGDDETLSFSAPDMAWLLLADTIVHCLDPHGDRLSARPSGTSDSRVLH